MSFSDFQAAVQIWAERVLATLNAPEVHSRVEIIGANLPLAGRTAPLRTRLGVSAPGFTAAQLLAAMDRPARAAAMHAAFPARAGLGYVYGVAESLAESAEPGWVVFDLLWHTLEIETPAASV